MVRKLVLTWEILYVYFTIPRLICCKFAGQCKSVPKSPATGRHNLQSFLAANLTKNHFLKARMIIVFVTFATKCRINILRQNQTIFDKGNGQRGRKKDKWGNVESKPLSISSFCLHFLILSPFPLHFIILSPFSRSQAARLPQLVQSWYSVYLMQTVFYSFKST